MQMLHVFCKWLRSWLQQKWSLKSIHWCQFTQKTHEQKITTTLVYTTSDRWDIYRFYEYAWKWGQDVNNRIWSLSGQINRKIVKNYKTWLLPIILVLYGEEIINMGGLIPSVDSL